MEVQVLSTRSLPSIENVEPLSQQDLPVIEDLYQILKKHGALQRFGITLLHEHFHVNDDEVLIETTNVERREQLIRPIKKELVEDLEAIETSWRLDTGKAVMNCKCVKFAWGHDHVERG